MLRRTTVNRINLKNKKNYSEVLLFGDIHYGASTCDYSFVDKVLARAEKEGWYIFGMGDMLEYATRSSVGNGCYDQIIRPQQQKEDMIDKLKPLAKKGMVLGLLEGNHEKRAVDSMDSNPIRDMCISLDIPYLGYSGYNIITTGSQSYTVFATHGNSGARTDVTKLNSAMKETRHRIVDMIWYGHTHGLANTTVPLEFLDKRNKGRIKKQKHILLTGSTLRYDNSYADDTGLEPAETGLFLVRFCSKEFNVEIKKITV